MKYTHLLHFKMQNDSEKEVEEDNHTVLEESMGKAGCILSSLTKGPNVYRYITRTEAVLLSAQGYHQAGHIMIHAPVPNVRLFNHIPVKHALMMQMRFDGFIGFPGGYLDDTDDSWEEGICREVREELGKSQLGFTVSPDDYLISHACDKKKLCLHFYAKEITYEMFKEIEIRDAEDDGDFENLGLVRVPLFTMSNKIGGFPNFLRNNFIDLAKDQLVYGIKSKELLSAEVLDCYLAFAARLS